MSKAKAVIDFIRYKLQAKDAHGIHSPFLFALYNNVISETEDYYELNKLAKIRKKLLHDQTELQVEDFGAGSKVFKGNTRKVADICKHGIAKEKYARLLFRLVNFSSPANVIELGTSIGLTTMYLSTAAVNAKIYTIEGSEQIADFANQLFIKTDRKNIEVINGNFDTELPKLLSNLETVDFAYIDGNHSKGPTLKYFELLLDKSHDSTVMVFDDINWSEDMKDAWRVIKDHPKVKLSIDLHFVGIVYFRAEQYEKEHFVLKY